MKLKSIRIENFRCFENEAINFNDYTCFVGPNGTGKSTVLAALNLFFRETRNVSTDFVTLSKDDFHKSNTSTPLQVTLTFTDLSVEAQEDFSAYYRHGELVVTAAAEWDDERSQATVTQHGQRLGIKAFGPFFAAVGKVAVVQLKEIYSQIRTQFADLPEPGSKQRMIDALLEYEGHHQERCELIRSNDQFYGFTKGSNLLEKHIQWVFVPAVKDPAGEQSEAKDTDLGRLLARTVRTSVSFEEELDTLQRETLGRYRELVQDQQQALGGLSSRLGTELQRWTHRDAKLKLKWHCDESKGVRLEPPMARVLAGEGHFTGDLTRSGHGFQRAFLLVLLQELASSGGGEGPRLLLGVEEPELYQHPPQARHMASVFNQLSENNAQVVLCTHSPIFVSGLTFENIRAVRRDRNGSGSVVRHALFDDIAGQIGKARGDTPQRPTTLAIKMSEALQPERNELFFADVVILVEGHEDAAYIRATLQMMGDEIHELFRSLRCHIVPVGGKNQLLQPIAVAKALEIPVFVVCDGDQGCDEKDIAKHSADNKAIQKLCGIDNPKDFPNNDLFAINLVLWSKDIGKVAKEDIGAEIFGDARGTVKEKLGLLGEKVSAKNPAMIGYALQVAWDAGHKSDRLQKLCTQILDFAAKFGPGVGAEGSTGGLELAVDHTLAANDAGDPVQPIVVTTSGHDVAANE